MAKNDFALDRVGKKIIEALQLNARMTNRDLAELVHLSPSASLKRTKKLEEQGFISHYTLALNLDNICQNIQVMAQIKLSDQQGNAADMRLERRIKQIPFATECFRIAGEFDYLVQFICRDIKHYNSLIEELMASDIGIARITSNVVMAVPKPFRQYPLDELNWRVENDE